MFIERRGCFLIVVVTTYVCGVCRRYAAFVELARRWHFFCPKEHIPNSISRQVGRLVTLVVDGGCPLFIITFK